MHIADAESEIKTTYFTPDTYVNPHTYLCAKYVVPFFMCDASSWHRRHLVHSRVHHHQPPRCVYLQAVSWWVRDSSRGSGAGRG